MQFQHDENLSFDSFLILLKEQLNVQKKKFNMLFNVNQWRVFFVFGD